MFSLNKPGDKKAKFLIQNIIIPLASACEELSLCNDLLNSTEQCWRNCNDRDGKYSQSSPVLISVNFPL